MSRTVKVFATGKDKNGRPYARAVVTATAEERLALLESGHRGTDFFALLNGLPPEAVARLTPGDHLTGEFVSSIRPETYVDDESGEERQGTACSVAFSGKVSRAAVTYAEVDW
jgi:hypothetical protein